MNHLTCSREAFAQDLMSWDGHRSTNRGKDVTYRLLGLLGLDMPLLHSERGVTTFKSSHLGIPGRSVGPTLVM